MPVPGAAKSTREPPAPGMTMFTVSDAWKLAFPDAHAGVLVMGNVSNPPSHPDLERQKTALESQLRSRFSGQDRSAIEALPIVQAYNAYYKRFKKTYHVQLQLESIAFKGKTLPRVAALVEAMFMAEVKNMLLTAGHDLDVLELPVTLDVSTGDERYTLLRGQEQVLKPGDMLMADQGGIISSILYGPDQRTQIKSSTQKVMFTVYAPRGIDEQMVVGHLQDIQENVRMFAPAAQVEMLNVFGVARSPDP
jgi:DNA/RNA-binding domain of Phe-tRNA-synthetase-like protein